MIFIKGKKTIEYNGNKYFIKRLVELTKTDDLKHMFKDGECTDLTTGEVFNISEIENIWKEKYSKLNDDSMNLLDYNKNRKFNKELNKDLNDIKLKELEGKYVNGEIDKDELMELIYLKYDNHKMYLNYDNYIKINKKIPNLNDSDLGKFYKILNKLTHKSNTLLNMDDIRSNPLSKIEISNLLGIGIKPTERYLKKLKDKGIIKHIIIDNKNHYMINPIYAFNGNVIGSYTYINFREEIEELMCIPPEIKKLWDYEFNISVIEG